MSRGSYEARPADLEQVIDAHSGPEAAARFGRAMDEVDVIGRAAAEQAGNTPITLDPAETARWQEAARQTTGTWTAEMSTTRLHALELVEAHRRPTQNKTHQQSPAAVNQAGERRGT